MPEQVKTATRATSKWLQRELYPGLALPEGALPWASIAK